MITWLMEIAFAVLPQEFDEEHERVLPEGKPILTPVRRIDCRTEIETSEYMRILTPADWQSFLARHKIPKEHQPQIDFSTSMVLAYNLRVTENYQVKHIDVLETKESIRVAVRAWRDLNRERDKGSKPLQEYSTLSMTVVPKSAKKVEFFLGYYTWAPECSRFTKPQTIGPVKD